jgi:hypothetical protein
MKINKSLFLGSALLIGSITANAQSLLNLVDSVQKNQKQPLAPLESTWKDTRLIEAQTTKTPAPGVMLFRIMHRFGNTGGPGGGIQALYGFDVVTDIYLSFDFGVTKNLELGFGRSKDNQLLDGSFKYKLLTQKSEGMPISLAVYGDAGITPESDALLYGGADSAVNKNFMDKLSYFGELIIDRRFGNFGSFEVFGGMSHRNYILNAVNLSNHAKEMNDVPMVGGAGRIRLTKHAALVFEYFYMMSQYRMNNPTVPFYNGFSVGYEIETGGHVFEVNFSNVAFINENNFIPNTNDSWNYGGFKLGFSISRAFNL